MHSMHPVRNKLFALLFALALFFTPLSVSAQKQSDNEVPAVGSPVSSLFDLGASVLTSATRMVAEDPYSEFRSAHYTNAGLLSERDEARLGDRLYEEVAKKYTIISAGQERANRIGQRVARTSLRPNMNYRFHVIESKEINAFSGPGGHVYVTSGLMNIANDDELASVLAHEVGHVVARHSLKTIEQSQTLGGLANLFGSITGVAGETAGQLGTAAASIVASGLLAVHNREEEREADYLGVHAMAKAGFNPQGMITMFQKLQRINRENSDLLGSLFNDHPDVDERISNTRYEINRMRPRGRR
jgi:predicted Zn-dependent protease